MTDDLNKYFKYAEDVISGRQIACQYVKDVCSRYLSWMHRTDICFYPKRAQKVIDFVEKLEHFQGKWAGKNFVLSEWQKFIIYYVFALIDIKHDFLFYLVFQGIEKSNNFFRIYYFKFWLFKHNQCL